VGLARIQRDLQHNLRELVHAQQKEEKESEQDRIRREEEARLRRATRAEEHRRIRMIIAWLEERESRPELPMPPERLPSPPPSP